jgi:hypothetical protein
MHDSTQPAQAPSALDVVTTLELANPRYWRLTGPRIVREWQESDSDDAPPTGAVKHAWWDLEYTENTEHGAKPLQVATLLVEGTDPLGPISRVDWGWGRARAVAMAYRVLAGLPGSEG